MTLQVHIAFQVNSLNCGEAFPNHEGCCSGAWLDFTSVRLKLTNMSLTGGWEQWKKRLEIHHLHVIQEPSQPDQQDLHRSLRPTWQHLPLYQPAPCCPWAAALLRLQPEAMGHSYQVAMQNHGSVGLNTRHWPHKKCHEATFAILLVISHCPLRRRAFIRRLKRINHESFHKKPWQLTP